jgi:hypothetical protein
VSASLHVTSNNLLFEIGKVHISIKDWMASPDLLQAAMVKLMKEKFEKYWGRWHEEKEKKKEDDTRLIANERVKGKKDDKENENINFLICVATAFGPRYNLYDYTKMAREEIYGLEM